MNVSHNTPDLLILEETPWIWGLVLTGIVLACLAGGTWSVFHLGEWGGWILIAQAPVWTAVAGFVVRRSQVVFNATDGWVELRQRTILRYRAVRHGLDEIDRAEVETVEHRDSETRKIKQAHRTVLVIEHGQSQGTHPMMALHREGPEAHEIAGSVNRWLSRHRD